MSLKKRSDLPSSLWNRLNSMKFAISLLIALGMASIFAIVLGEFFPANVPGGDEFYLNKMGTTRFNLLKSLGVFNPYHSFWYIGLLAILSLSMTTCTIKRLPAMWRLAFSKNYKSSKEDILHLKNAKSFRTITDSENIKDTLSRILRRRFYRVAFKEKDRTTLLFADKGGVARIGVIFLHFGLVISFFGGLLATLFGYSVYYWGKPGEVLSVPERDFQVRVDDFKILTNPQGQIKDYLCTLTIWEHGEEIRTEQIEVNKPLRHKGISFYQSSYRPNPRSVKSVTLHVHGPGEETGLKIVHIAQNDTVPIERSNTSIQLVDFVGNFRLEGGKVFSMPGLTEFRNPAVKLNVFDDNNILIKTGWVFSPRMAGFHTFLEGYRFELVNFVKIFDTGLNIRKNPGGSWIWCGLILMTLGILLIFSLTHKRIWGIIVDVNGTEREITLGGLSNKNKGEFTQEILRLINDLKSISLEMK